MLQAGICPFRGIWRDCLSPRVVSGHKDLVTSVTAGEEAASAGPLCSLMQGGAGRIS